MDSGSQCFFGRGWEMIELWPIWYVQTFCDYLNDPSREEFVCFSWCNWLLSQTPLLAHSLLSHCLSVYLSLSFFLSRSLSFYLCLSPLCLLSFSPSLLSLSPSLSLSLSISPLSLSRYQVKHPVRLDSSLKSDLAPTQVLCSSPLQEITK